MTRQITKGYVPGCIGRITELHATYYHRHAGFGFYFEEKVATELAEFMRRYDDRRDGLWLLMADDSIEGSIVIDGMHGQDQGAHLRWFIVSERVRGTGSGRALMETAIRFCDSRHYARIRLSTFEGLNAARHLYEKFGFRLMEQQRASSWGTEVNEQRFELVNQRLSRPLMNEEMQCPR